MANQARYFFTRKHLNELHCKIQLGTSSNSLHDYLNDLRASYEQRPSGLFPSTPELVNHPLTQHILQTCTHSLSHLFSNKHLSHVQPLLWVEKSMQGLKLYVFCQSYCWIEAQRSNNGQGLFAHAYTIENESSILNENALHMLSSHLANMRTNVPHKTHLELGRNHIVIPWLSWRYSVKVTPGSIAINAFEIGCAFKHLEKPNPSLLLASKHLYKNVESYSTHPMLTAQIEQSQKSAARAKEYLNRQEAKISAQTYEVQLPQITKHPYSTPGIAANHRLQSQLEHKAFKLKKAAQHYFNRCQSIVSTSKDTAQHDFMPRSLLAAQRSIQNPVYGVWITTKQFVQLIRMTSSQFIKSILGKTLERVLIFFLLTLYLIIFFSKIILPYLLSAVPMCVSFALIYGAMHTKIKHGRLLSWQLFRSKRVRVFKEEVCELPTGRYRLAPPANELFQYPYLTMHNLFTSENTRLLYRPSH